MMQSQVRTITHAARAPRPATAKMLRLIAARGITAVISAPSAVTAITCRCKQWRGPCHRSP
jgi:hypothetical protein